MEKGILIIINGGSSAGKTSTCEAFQDITEGPFVRMGIDKFWTTIPPKQMQIDKVSPEFYTTKTYFKGEKPYFHITPGPILDRVMYASYQAIAEYLDSGMNVISDQLFWKSEWLHQLLRTFQDYKVYVIALKVSDEEGARRERMRSRGDDKDTSSGGRPAGWNRCSSYLTHQGMMYDLEIDNTSLPVAEVANRIKLLLESVHQPTAFKALVKKYL